MSTNFISNVAFFKRYGTRIYGMTGTMGSDETRRLLSDVYNTDTCVVPAYKSNEIAGPNERSYICKELPAIVSRTEHDWYEAVCESSLSKTRNDRAVLIICKYVVECEYLLKMLKSKTSKAEHGKLFTYTGQGNGQFTKRSIDSGEIIIATNIAGRGTDIKTSPQVELNGGMHVCVTFLPDNLRVEFQNVGRTARQGQNGTAQLVVLDKSNLTADMEELRRTRDEREVRAIDKAREDVKQMLLRDELFAKFCQLEEEILPFDAKDKDKLGYERKGLEERWSIWLRAITQEIDTVNFRLKFISIL